MNVEIQKVVSIGVKSSKPDENSPVGQLMARILKKNPDITFDVARHEAHRLMSVAAGRKKYRVPPVLTPAEQAEQSTRLRSAFGKSVKDAA
jgi:hypothetical protein